MNEWAIVLIGLAIASAGFAIHRTVRQCTKLFSSPQPTEKEREVAFTPYELPEGIQVPEQQVLCQQAKDCLFLWLNAWNNRRLDTIQTFENVLELKNRIDGQIAKGERERFEQLKAHHAVVVGCNAQRVEIMVSMQAIHYVACKGQLIMGREDLPTQMVWKIVARYPSPHTFTICSIEKIKPESKVFSK